MSGPIQPKKTLLWIDDYEPGLMIYQAIFEKLGFRVLTALRPDIALQVAGSQHVDAVITDYEMPEMNGADVAAVLKRRDPQLPIILFTGLESLPNGVRNVADACCDKAAPLDRLLATLYRLLFNQPGQSLQSQVLRPPSEQEQRTFA